MKVKDITNCLEAFSPLKHAEDFDNVGLLVGDYQMDVSGVLVALDALEEVIDEAIENKCNLVVSFHPIIFKGLRKINGNSYVERVVVKAIHHNIAIYAIHTALDNCDKGVNAKICEVLGLTNQKILIPKNNHDSGVQHISNQNPTVGMGMIGEFTKAFEEKDFINYLKKTMKTNCVRHSKLLGKPVRRVAVLGGSGSFAIENAIEKKADVFVTSDLKYHDFFRAENQLVLADIGHFESEQFTVDLLVDVIQKKFPNFTVFFSKKHLNPINYS